MRQKARGHTWYLPTSASTYSVNDDVLVFQVRGVLGGDDHVEEQPFVLGSHQLTRPLGGLGRVVARQEPDVFG